ncbi:hypothetical protein RFI_10015 [Reticulomyxa filosa]|uniref:Uncharacterized protein n=1 Tax=Reticulomyxa filosa TaxID=46433 RepID=X6NN29_RETFI|nr:hypothetical protein RFI_10015 [Reticulomyxa filosa]|eukprot:ETO27119.1 hypothetical protein RFI_10015 [Reticulomyxa filosa]
MSLRLKEMEAEMAQSISKNAKKKRMKKKNAKDAAEKLPVSDNNNTLGNCSLTEQQLAKELHNKFNGKMVYCNDVYYPVSQFDHNSKRHEINRYQNNLRYFQQIYKNAFPLQTNQNDTTEKTSQDVLPKFRKTFFVYLATKVSDAF